jgi:hypothetical protein
MNTLTYHLIGGDEAVPVAGSRPSSGSWPDEQGRWPEALRPLDRVNTDTVGDAVVIHRGQLIAEIGGSRKNSGLWSSCIRTWMTLKFLKAIHEGRIAKEQLWLPVGPPFPSNVLLIHVLSRTSNANPPGSAWRYSGGFHWPAQHAKHEELTGDSREESARQLADAVGARLTWDRDPDDDTQRMDGSPYEMAKLGYLMLREGQWQDRRVFDADLWRMATGGGVTGDGNPYPLEGWQVHLIRGGVHSELGTRPRMDGVGDGYFGAGGTNRGYVVVLPDRDVVIARVRRSGVYLDQFLPDLLKALDL